MLFQKINIKGAHLLSFSHGNVTDKEILLIVFLNVKLIHFKISDCSKRTYKAQRLEN